MLVETTLALGPMTQDNAAPHSRADAPLELPEGLDTLSVELSFPDSKTLFGKLDSKFPKGKLTARRDDGTGARHFMPGTNALHQGHFHLTLELQKASGDVSLSLEVFPTTNHKEFARGSWTLADSIKALGAVLPKECPCIVSATYTKRLSEWRPTFRLPMNTDELDGMPGRPEVTGVDLVYRDSKSSDSLHRAFVTTYDTLDQVVVRLLFFDSLPWDNGLVRNAVRRVEGHLQHLLTKDI